MSDNEEYFDINKGDVEDGEEEKKKELHEEDEDDME